MLAEYILNVPEIFDDPVVGKSVWYIKYIGQFWHCSQLTHRSFHTTLLLF